tara:strand:+ start:146 stop:481 length:336 start_codon:yes stop_codon:yes gene_type:complete
MLTDDDRSESRKRPLEEYRKKVAVRPLETHNQYRNRVGRIAKHRQLMSHRPDRAQRKDEIKRYQEMVARVTEKCQRELAKIEANTPTFREKQIAYDKARGAYESDARFKIT